MNTAIYISISDKRGQLIVDGDLKLLGEFFSAMRLGLLPVEVAPAKIDQPAGLPAVEAIREPALGGEVSYARAS